MDSVRETKMKTMSMNILKILIGVVLLKIGLLAQTGQVLYKHLLVNVTVPTVSAVVVPAYGQTNHIIHVNIEGAACTVAATGLNVSLEGSYDNTNFFPIGVPMTRIGRVDADSFAGSRFYTGFYPFLRANLLVVSNFCTFNVYYSGAIGSPLLLSAVTAADLGFDNTILNTDIIDTTVVGRQELLANFAALGFSRWIVYGYTLVIPAGQSITNMQLIQLESFDPIVYWNLGTLTGPKVVVVDNDTSVPLFEVHRQFNLAYTNESDCIGCRIQLFYRIE